MNNCEQQQRTTGGQQASTQIPANSDGPVVRSCPVVRTSEVKPSGGQVVLTLLRDKEIDVRSGEWLREFLAGKGRVMRAEAMRAATRQGVDLRGLDGAATALGVVKTREGFHQYWELPL